MLLPTIDAPRILSIDDMSGGGQSPVWLLRLRDCPTALIIKAEHESNPSEAAAAKANIKAMSDVMALVSPTSLTARLEKDEVDALDKFAARPIALLRAVRGHNAGTNHLTKMKFDSTFFSSINGPVNAIGFSQGMSPAQTARSALLFSGLRNNKIAWQTLGQVLIADAFIGNGDRFNLTARSVQNFGNLIFSRDDQGVITRAVGHDMNDPNSPVKFLYGTNMQAPMGFDWVSEYGRHIKDKTTFGQLSAGIVDYINKERAVPLGLQPFRDEQAFFMQGMWIGWDKLANAIGIKYRAGAGLPPLTTERAKYIGFIK